MTDEARDRLLALSARLADGEAIDWERARRELPPELIERLASLEAMFATMRSVGAGEQEPGSADDIERESWGHLEIVAPLARGGFGVVYRAFDPILQREVALKLRRPDAAPTRDDDHDAAWIREARRLARVRHPNVLAVHGADVHDGVPGLWSDLVQGETLRDHADSGDPSRDRLLSWAGQLAAAVGAVHAAGIVHGDIKPSNVMVEGGDRIVLMDFGAGRDTGPSAEAVSEASSSAPPSAATGSLRPGTSLVGSPLVMAPECLGGGSPSFASDVYALGAVLHYAASGRYPVEAERVSELTQALAEGVRVDLSGTAAPHSLQRLVSRMLDRDAARRPSIAEVADEIESIRGAPARRRRIAAVSAIIGLLVAGLAVSTVGYFRVRAADAETEAVNAFMREILVAPRGSEAGREVRVVELLEKAVPTAEQRYADQPMLLARIRDLVGRTYVSLGSYETAEPLLREALETFTARYGESDPRSVALLGPLARVAFETGDLEQAGEIWQRMRELSQDLTPSARVNAITARIGLADIARNTNRLDEAASLLRETAELDVDPATAAEALRARMVLADVLGRAGHYEEADGIAAAALERALEVHGQRHATTISARHALVGIRANRGALESAEQLARENLAVAMEWVGQLDRMTVVAQSELSNVLHMRGDVEPSLELLEKARDAAEKVFPPGAVQPMNLSVNLVARYLDLGRYRDAVEQAERNAVELAAVPSGVGNTGMINGINLAEGYYRLGRYDEALEQARAMQQAVTDAFGASHPFARVAEGFVGAALAGMGRFAAADDVLQRAYDALAESLGPEHALALDVAGFRAEVLLGLGRPGEAVELARRVHAGLLEVYGAGHLKVRGIEQFIQRAETDLADGTSAAKAADQPAPEQRADSRD